MEFKIEKIQEQDKEIFKEMLLDYLHIEEEKRQEVAINLVENWIFVTEKKKIVYIDMAKIEDECIGFVIYQIDCKESDWCKRPGWGFIRELCVLEKYRQLGVGTQLLSHAESKLKALKPKGIYLTSEESWHVKKFYTKNGYENTHVRDDENGEEIFEKGI